jgi:cytochrome c oxidase subunit 2
MNLTNIYRNFLINFYNFILLWVLLIVLFSIIILLIKNFFQKKEIKVFLIEIFLTIFSLFLILFSFVPRFQILKFLEKESFNFYSFNIFGYQWYWNYFFYLNNFRQKLEDLNIRNFFNFANFNQILNNSLILPLNRNILIISISDNVIHSWFIPNLNIKLETNPGFINYFFTNINKCGLFFGNCAEICGQGHSLIPISVEVVPINYFLKFYK